MSRIRKVGLRPIYDSRGQLTISATVETEIGAQGTAGAPSGASTGRHEVQAFPPGGVPEALRVFDQAVAPRLVGAETHDQEGVDRLLHNIDGTENFRRIGGNTSTAVSIANALAHAHEERTPLWKVLRRANVDGRAFPAIVGNCLNGGRHAIGGPDFQEFLTFATDPDPIQATRAAFAVHQKVGELLHAKWPKRALGRGDEGGWVAPIGNLEALELFVDACASVRDELHSPVHPGLDLAASEFYRNGRYHLREQTFDAEGQFGFLVKLVQKFDLRYLEDPFFEEDFDSFARLTQAVGDRTLVVGDDLFTTSVERVREGLNHHSANSVLIKVNQIGTLTDASAVVDLARAAGWSTVASHRSGDLPEGWLAHLAVGFGSRGLKCGLVGGERVAKLNELLRLGGAMETERNGS